MGVKHLDINGFFTRLDWGGTSTFYAPYVYYVYPNPSPFSGKGPLSSVVVPNEVAFVLSKDSHVGLAYCWTLKHMKMLVFQDSSKPWPTSQRYILIFLCVPISPGKSRLIWSFPRNFDAWKDRIIPRWFFHLQENLVLDSDLYLLHLEV